MVRLIMMEFYKLRHSWILVSALLGSAVAPLMSSLMYFTAARNGRAFLYSSIYAQNFMFGALLVNLLLYGLVWSFLLHREYQEKTLSSVLTIPVSRVRFLTAKILTCSLLTVTFSFLSLLFATLGGVLLGAQGWSPDLFIEALGAQMKSAGLIIPCLVVVLLVTMVSKNYFVPIGASIVVVILNLFVMNSETWAYLFPWLYPFMLAVVPGSQGTSLDPTKLGTSWAIWAGFTVLVTGLAYAVFVKADSD